MKRFSTGQNVIVKQNEDGIALSAPGVVGRVRTDGSAFVTLDVRSKLGSGVHPFPADDQRGMKVIAYPEDCELDERNRAQRRAAARAAGEPLPTIETFGRDHWSTFAYLETVCVDRGGVPESPRMRCDRARHPLHFQSIPGLPEKKYPTRLKGDATLENHDDWDCADDLVDHGLLEDVGTHANPRFAMTEKGHLVAMQIRKHKASGGVFDTFTPVIEEIAVAKAG